MLDVRQANLRPVRGHPMHHTDQIKVEVTISPELRFLMAERASPPPSTPKPEPAPVAPRQESGTPTGLPLAEIRLRQDGAKPVRFRGAPAFKVDGELQRHSASIAHHFALYLDAAGKIHAAVSLEPGDAAGVRPSYRCAVLNDTLELHTWLELWLRDVLGPVLSGPRRNCAQTQPTVLAAFHTLTGHCLRSANPSFERKEPCLQ